jgi:hypothetical protein
MSSCLKHLFFHLSILCAITTLGVFMHSCHLDITNGDRRLTSHSLSANLWYSTSPYYPRQCATLPSSRRTMTTGQAKHEHAVTPLQWWYPISSGQPNPVTTVSSRATSAPTLYSLLDHLQLDPATRLVPPPGPSSTGTHCFRRLHNAARCIVLCNVKDYTNIRYHTIYSGVPYLCNICYIFFQDGIPFSFSDIVR